MRNWDLKTSFYETMTFKIRIKPDSLSVFFYGTDTFIRVVLIGKFDSILSVSHTNNVIFCNLDLTWTHRAEINVFLSALSRDCKPDLYKFLIAFRAKNNYEAQFAKMKGAASIQTVSAAKYIQNRSIPLNRNKSYSFE